jgi:hypothetical protein
MATYKCEKCFLACTAHGTEWYDVPECCGGSMSLVVAASLYGFVPTPIEPDDTDTDDIAMRTRQAAVRTQARNRTPIATVRPYSDSMHYHH